MIKYIKNGNYYVLLEDGWGISFKRLFNFIKDSDIVNVKENYAIITNIKLCYIYYYDWKLNNNSSITGASFSCNNKEDVELIVDYMNSILMYETIKK